MIDAGFPEDLEDAAILTHTQALHYLYSVEEMAMTFPKSALRRFASSSHHQQAAEVLVSAGLWTDLGRRFQVLHHEDVFRQSLAAQLTKRDRDKGQKRRKRSRGVADGVGSDVDSDSGTDGDSGVGATQSVSHSSIQASGDNHGDAREDVPASGGGCVVPGCSTPITEYARREYGGWYCAPHGEEPAGGVPRG